MSNITKKNLTVSYIILCVFILACIITTIIHFNLTNIKTYNRFPPTSPLQNWNNENIIELKELVNSQWNWKYQNNGRKIVQLCGNYNHDAVFFANNELVSSYKNKKENGFDVSYLLNHKKEKLFKVYTGSPWKEKINNDVIIVNYIIIDLKTMKIIAYVDNNLFTQKKFTFKNIYGDDMVTISNNFLDNQKVWTYIQYPNKNIIPLSLVISISSRISFMKNMTDNCNIQWQITYSLLIIFLTFLSFSLLSFSIMIYQYNKSKKLQVI